MKSTKIKIVVELTVTSPKPLTDDNKNDIVGEMNYNFDFEEMVDQGCIMIADTEIVEILEG